MTDSSPPDPSKSADKVLRPAGKAVRKRDKISGSDDISNRVRYSGGGLLLLMVVCILGGGAVAAAVLLTRGKDSNSDAGKLSSDAPLKSGSLEEPTRPGDLVPTFAFNERKTFDDFKCNVSFLEVDDKRDDLGVDDEGDDEYFDEEDPMNIFSPDFQEPVSENDGFNRRLRCNSEMMRSLEDGSACCDTTLSSLLDRPQSQREPELVIPCGTCIIVDFEDGTELELPDGLRIEGLLYFPPSSNVTIRTTHVWVVGTLKVDVLSQGNKVKFHLYGEEDVWFENTGAHAELDYCSTTCNLGAKPIAVIGGRLEIQAYDPSCVAWEKLQAVVDSTPCGYDNLLQNGDMEDNTNFTWQGEVTESAYKSPGYSDAGSSIVAFGGDELDWRRGIAQQLDLDCLENGQEFIFRAKVKLYDAKTNQPVSCDRNVDRQCPMVRLCFVVKGGTECFEYHDNDAVWKVGEWNDIELDFPVEIDHERTLSGNIYICGGPVGSTLEIDNVLMVHKEKPVNQIIVSPEAVNCWGAGTELLLTSHTKDFHDRQVVIVESVDIELRILTLNQTIKRPITVEDHEIFAVEIASLTRPVVFEAESNTDDALIGGHLIVFGTATPQHLEGVEIRNFGQQGRLGRYPTHFHFCGDSYGSLMRKNVVRDSNQRCYVLHQSNGVLVEQNVAFNTFGHCYFLEDGVEINNVFKKNLGADVKIATKLLSEQSGRIETDHLPSIFWISNPLNYFYGNVAAGGESKGYWFETTKDRTYMDLGAFDDNEGHSLEIHSFTTYFPGWQPTNLATFRNVKMYRNPRNGMFLHNTRNLRFLGGVVADSTIGAYVLGGDDITFVGTHFIGDSKAKATDPPRGCDPLVTGLLLHSGKRVENSLSGTIKGTTLIDVEFTNFAAGTTGCAGELPPMRFAQSHISTPTFDAPHTFVNISIESGVVPLDACGLLDVYGVDDIAIEVTEDPMGSFSDGAQPGFIVSPKLAAFTGTECTPYDGGCMDFCEIVCLRTVRFLTNAGAGNNTMVVNDGSKSIRLTRALHTKDPNNRNLDAVYNVALPVPLDSINVHFEDENGTLVYPDYVIPVLEAAPFCTNHIQHEDITVVRPPPDPVVCSNLVKNGDFDADIAGWQDTWQGITWDATSGVASSGALTSLSRATSEESMSQWLNVNCLAEGQIYDFSLSFKVMETMGQASSPLIDCSLERCAEVVVQTFSFDPATGEFEESSPIVVADTVSLVVDGEGFRTVTGSWQVTTDQANADKVLLFFTVYPAHTQYVVDVVRGVVRIT